MLKLALILFGVAFLNNTIKDATNFDFIETVTTKNPEISGVIVTVIVLIFLLQIFKKRRKK
jgi:hypothetical protein